MKDIKFYINDEVIVQNNKYIVTGYIQYKNLNDGYVWFEYRLKELNSNTIAWLSIDNLYEEYAIYRQERNSYGFTAEEIERQGYREADSGVQAVIDFNGRMDVDKGEQARFWEYEDGDAEKIIAIEEWSDGREYSTGHYLDRDDISIIGQNTIRENSNSFQKNKSIMDYCLAVGSVLLIMFVIVVFLVNIGGSYLIEKHLEESSSYRYVTSITSDRENEHKADVYRSSLSLDETVKNIIDYIEGDTEYIQQNKDEDDSSVAIITKEEYCFVYESEDNEILVQISSRQYAYSSTNTIYKGRSGSYRYYRRYYYSTVYSKDKSSFGSSSDSFSGYQDGNVSTNSSDTYSSYASSVRQNSILSRRSSGGGTSSGK